MRAGPFGLRTSMQEFAQDGRHARSGEQNPATIIEPKPAGDQAARLRAALGDHPACAPSQLLVSGAKGGVGTTAVADAVRTDLARIGLSVLDHGRDLPDVAGPAPGAWVLVVTPEPAALVAAFDVIRSFDERSGRGTVAPLLVINRSPSSACSRRAFERLGAALRAIGSIGTVFAGHIPFDPVFGRASARGERFVRGGCPAARSCRVLSRRFAEFLRPVVTASPALNEGVIP